MDILQLVLLAIVQGLTEFLPISSSAHLIIPAQILDLSDQGLAFDIAVHVGSLFAVIFYLRDEIYQLAAGWLKSISGGGSSPESRLVWYLAIGTIPVGLGGLLLGDFVETYLRSIAVIASTTIIFAIVLALADKKGVHQLDMNSLTWKSALMIGLAQMLALIPGTSRSGITMTAALALGFKRTEAARYSFLLAIPVIVLSGGYQAVQFGTAPASVSGQALVPWGDMLIGMVVSALTAFTCIHFFLALVNRIGMMPFVWYRLVLGAVLFGFVFAGV
ncbi:MAG: undecaprenyl-diphosphate phosphatase [Porticoccaceae bacterium]|nr:undecaprenyl-diphosphate phosphatase [Porticoccaceae bacterium]